MCNWTVSLDRVAEFDCFVSDFDRHIHDTMSARSNGLARLDARSAPQMPAPLERLPLGFLGALLGKPGRGKAYAIGTSGTAPRRSPLGESKQKA